MNVVFILSLQSAMDAARLSAAKSSPMMETVNMVRKRLLSN